MNTIGKIACKTIGIAGMSAILYDAYAVGKHYSMVGSKAAEGKLILDTYAASRTTTNESPVTNAVQKKVADLRLSMPLIPLIGKIKGFFKGSIESLGDNIIPVAFTSMAIAGKGFWAKLGAWGTAISALLVILKESFGLGKQSPMDK